VIIMIRTKTVKGVYYNSGNNVKTTTDFFIVMSKLI
jgi:hypothetical protein